MGRLIDADEVVAMLRQEAKEWMAVAEQYPVDTFARGLRAGIASGYAAAAQDVEDLVKEQAAGNVPADGSE